MNIFCKFFLWFALLSISFVGHARSVDVSSIHYWTAPDRARVMIDVSSMPDHRIVLLKQPARLSITIHNAQLRQPLNQPLASHPLFSKLRAKQDDNDVRIIANLKRQVKYNSFALKPNDVYGHRLVVDLTDLGPVVLANAAPQSVNKEGASNTAEAKGSNKTSKKRRGDPAKAVAPVSTRSKRIVVAIDAGHGGEDPGARGSKGTEEKKVAFAIARKLDALINGQKGMKAVMVRKGDYYVNLRKRMEIARAANADLFISIHADAFKKSHVKGASVFTLSSSGASSEAARWLANSENASDLVGGVKLDDKEGVLATVLLDLSQSATQEASSKVAGHVLKNFENIGELHFDNVQKAGFLVLKSPDIPSILVETGFLSNPSEERKLTNSAHQSKIALAIFKGVRDYFKQFEPVDTRVAGL